MTQEAANFFELIRREGLIVLALAAGDRVYFQEEANADNSGTLQITGKSEYADYTIFDVELVKQTGSAIPKNADVVVRFTFHQPLKDQP